MNESNFEKTLLYIDSVDREPNSNINDFIVNLELPKRRIKYIMQTVCVCKEECNTSRK